MPKAHFKVSFGTFRTERPASAAGWNRALLASTPHPFQYGSVAGSGSDDGCIVQRPAFGSAGGSAMGDRNAASAAFSTAVRPVAIGAIDPPVDSAATIDSRLRARSASREGALIASGESAAPS